MKHISHHGRRHRGQLPAGLFEFVVVLGEHELSCEVIGVDESLLLFEQMRRGELQDGAAVLRAEIDMSAPNMKLRDRIAPISG